MMMMSAMSCGRMEVSIVFTAPGKDAAGMTLADQEVGKRRVSGRATSLVDLPPTCVDAVLILVGVITRSRAISTLI